MCALGFWCSIQIKEQIGRVGGGIIHRIEIRYYLWWFNVFILHAIFYQKHGVIDTLYKISAHFVCPLHCIFQVLFIVGCNASKTPSTSTSQTIWLPPPSNKHIPHSLYPMKHQYMGGKGQVEHCLKNYGQAVGLFICQVDSMITTSTIKAGATTWPSQSNSLHSPSFIPSSGSICMG